MTLVVTTTLFALWGLVVGGAYFALVRRTAKHLTSGEVHITRALGAIGLRMVLFAPGAVVAAMLSLIALGGYMAGFIVARILVVHFAAQGERS